MPLAAAGRHTGQLHRRPARDPAERQAHGGTRRSNRRYVLRTRISPNWLPCLRSLAAPLAAHLEAENVEFIQFAFRWMNCLLMREISVQNTIRMWDTYLVSLHIPNRDPNDADYRLRPYRRKAQMHSRSSTSTCARLSS